MVTVTLKHVTDACRQNTVFFCVMQQTNNKTEVQFNHKSFVNTIRGPTTIVIFFTSNNTVGCYPHCLSRIVTSLPAATHFMRANNAKQNKNKTIFAWQSHHWLRNYNHPASLLLYWYQFRSGVLRRVQRWSAPHFWDIFLERSSVGQVCTRESALFVEQSVVLLSLVLVTWQVRRR